ncbi:MAG: glucose-6-phosphate isomerase [Burkholderiales bacterium]
MNAIARKLTELPAWQRLAAHRSDTGSQPFDLAMMFKQDPQRAATLSARCGGVLLDYSKQLLNAETMRLLVDLARERDLSGAIARLFAGGIVNVSENRAALHTALRAQTPVMLDGRDVTVDVRRELERMRAFVATVRSDHTITDVIHIGIGGSYLGPAFAGEALAAYTEKSLRVHTLSTVDGGALQQLLARLDARATLVIVATKTFTTPETMTNARAVQRWMAGQLGDEPAALKQFAAVTAMPERAVAFGIAREHIFEVWDWVGGRYSLCSTMALPLALQVGMEYFDALRAGAHAADEHFRTAEFDQNLPVILALLDVWNANFHGAASRVVLPYLSGFARFPAYLQQLEMESLGKRVTTGGAAVDVDTGLVVWGESGTNGQHAFHQLLHQGTRLIPADFIIACRAAHNYPGHHDMLLANALAQAEALMIGNTANEPHRAYPGNRPSTMLVLPEADAFHLGMLVALYEHKVYAASVIWDINAFDQWGVELGKQLAGRLLHELSPHSPQASQTPAGTHDASTASLIQHIKKNAGRLA